MTFDMMSGLGLMNSESRGVTIPEKEGTYKILIETEDYEGLLKVTGSHVHCNGNSSG